MGYYSQEELEKLGFAYLGRNVRLSDKASVYNPQKIHIGDYSRVDDFCVLSAGTGGIKIGSYVHIAIYSSLIGKGEIRIGDFANLSSRVSVYSSNDDYSGAYLTNPTVNEQYTNVLHAPVTIEKHAIIGSGSIVLPGVVVGEGVSIGALSLVNKNCDPFMIYVGTPVKPLKERSRKLLEQERLFLEQASEP